MARSRTTWWRGSRPGAAQSRPARATAVRHISAVASTSRDVRPSKSRRTRGRREPGQVWPAPRETQRVTAPGSASEPKLIRVSLGVTCSRCGSVEWPFASAQAVAASSTLSCQRSVAPPSKGLMRSEVPWNATTRTGRSSEGRAGARSPATGPKSMTVSGFLAARRLDIRAPPDMPAMQIRWCAAGYRSNRAATVARRNLSSPSRSHSYPDPDRRLPCGKATTAPSCESAAMRLSRA